MQQLDLKGSLLIFSAGKETNDMRQACGLAIKQTDIMLVRQWLLSVFNKISLL
jgi:hypothetical protein